MSPADRLNAEQAHLAALLEAIQRSVYFLDASQAKLAWPLATETLCAQRKDIPLFETLAALNERFAKLQDTLGAAMRHAALLAGEPTETFLRTLGFFEKIGVLRSVADWQLARTARNLAAHAYDTDYAAIAEHFNTLHELIPRLYGTAGRLLEYCRRELAVEPTTLDFDLEFKSITAGTGGSGAQTG